MSAYFTNINKTAFTFSYIEILNPINLLSIVSETRAQQHNSPGQEPESRPLTGDWFFL